jgi:transposase
MLGPVKARRVDQPVTTSLGALVPTDHFYRHLECCLDLSFVRELAREAYAAGGRPSIDPIIFFKLQLILFFEGIRSERQLIEIASLNLAHRWYLGYALDEPLPDHSSLTRIRTRLGIEVFQRFFEQVVALCQETGLVWGTELFVDATKVRANADLDSVVPRFYWEAKHHAGSLFDQGVSASQEQSEESSLAEAGTGTAVAAEPAGFPRHLPTEISAEIATAPPPEQHLPILVRAVQRALTRS